MLIVEDGTGIYSIRNVLNGKCYVGSAVNFRRRWNKHLSELRRGVHHSRKLQNAWLKHGEESFVFERLLVCDTADLMMYEQIVMDAYEAYSRGYNARPKAESSLGFRHSAESKAKVSVAKIGVKRPPISAEHRAKISAANVGHKRCLGYKHTDEARENMRNRGFSDAHRSALSEALKGNANALGVTHSEATRNKVSSALLGNTRRRGKTTTEEARRKIGDAFRGVPKSAEQRAKMAESARRRWAKVNAV